MEYVELVSRWLHILPAITLIGGAAFMRFAFLPSVGSSGDSGANELAERVRSRWSTVVKASIALLLISGLYNSFVKATSFELDMTYNGLLLVKILLALAIFFLASVLTGKSNAAKKFRERESYWLTVNLLLSIVLVCIAGFLKAGEYDKKVKETGQATVTSGLEVR